jgi:hypothetical protein
MSPAAHSELRRRGYRFAVENVPKTDGLGGVVMNVESGSVKAIPRGKGRERRRAGSRSAALARTGPSGGFALKTGAGRVGAVDCLNRALDCGPQAGDLDLAGRIAVQLAGARARRQRTQKRRTLADLA